MIKLEDAKSYIFSKCEPFVINHSYCETDSKYLHRKAVLKYIEKIYDSLDEKTCDNCKYDNFENSRCDLKRHIPSYYLDGFFCNRWEVK